MIKKIKDWVTLKLCLGRAVYITNWPSLCRTAFKSLGGHLISSHWWLTEWFHHICPKSHNRWVVCFLRQSSHSGFLKVSAKADGVSVFPLALYQCIYLQKYFWCPFQYSFFGVSSVFSLEVSLNVLNKNWTSQSYICTYFRYEMTIWHTSLPTSSHFVCSMVKSMPRIATVHKPTAL